MSDDKKIIQDCLNGNVDSYKNIVNKYQSMVLKTAYRMLGNWQDAKDASQDVFIKAYRSLTKYNHEYAFSTWLYRILVNICKDYLKSAHRKYRCSLEQTEKKLQEKNDLETTIGNSDLIQFLLMQLPLKRRRAFVLMEIKNLTAMETGNILGCAESTVRVQAMKARKQLKKIYFDMIQSGEKNRDM